MVRYYAGPCKNASVFASGPLASCAAPRVVRAPAAARSGMPATCITMPIRLCSAFAVPGRKWRICQNYRFLPMHRLI